VKSIQGLEDKKDLAFLYKKGNRQNDQHDDSNIDGQDADLLRIQAEEREIA